jgi:threonine/homoserine/homoserine lactone efflux protein
MTVDSITALFGFAFVMSISPGPGNFLLLSSGANFGFIKSLPLVLGISIGFLSIVVLVGIGLGEILKQNPVIFNLLRIICGGYVIWLAAKIASSRSLGADSSDKMMKPIGFVQAALLQWLNPKAWAVALIATVAYTTPDNYLINLILLVVLFALVNIPTISVWALSGAALRSWLSKGKRIVFFNYTMSILLVGSIIPMLIDGN